MSKTFKFAGVSRRNGTMKARFASDQMRVKVLAKTGSSDIDLIELEHAMTKEAAVEFLLKINFDNGNAEVREALEAYLSKHTPKAAKSAKVAKTAAAAAAAASKAAKAKSKPTMDSIKAKAQAAKSKQTAVTKAEVEAQLEDAPF